MVRDGNIVYHFSMPMIFNHRGRIYRVIEVSQMLDISPAFLKTLRNINALRFVVHDNDREYLTEEGVLLLMSCPWRYSSVRGKNWLKAHSRSEFLIANNEDLGVE